MTTTNDRPIETESPDDEEMREGVIDRLLEMEQLVKNATPEQLDMLKAVQFHREEFPATHVGDIAHLRAGYDLSTTDGVVAFTARLHEVVVRHRAVQAGLGDRLDEEGVAAVTGWDGLDGAVPREVRDELADVAILAADLQPYLIRLVRRAVAAREAYEAHADRFEIDGVEDVVVRLSGFERFYSAFDDLVEIASVAHMPPGSHPAGWVDGMLEDGRRQPVEAPAWLNLPALFDEALLADLAEAASDATALRCVLLSVAQRARRVCNRFDAETSTRDLPDDVYALVSESTGYQALCDVFSGMVLDCDTAIVNTSTPAPWAEAIDREHKVAP